MLARSGCDKHKHANTERRRVGRSVRAHMVADRTLSMAMEIQASDTPHVCS